MLRQSPHLGTAHKAMTDIQAWRSKLLQQIEAAGLLQRPRRVELEHGVPGLAGRVDVEGRWVGIALNVDPLRFHRLPTFILRPPDALGFIPHIDQGGVICFLEEEGIIFDRRRPLDVIRDCLLHVRRTLREGVTNTSQDDLVNEFEVYWARLDNRISAISDLAGADLNQAAEVCVASSPHATYLRIAHDSVRIPHVPDLFVTTGPWSAHRALYLPLEPDLILLPPQSEPPFWGSDGVRRLLSHCSAENRALLEGLLQKRGYTHQFLIVRLPRPAGDAAFFGVRFEQLRDRHPLLNTDTVEAIRPMVIFRRDRHYLVQRGGGHMELAGRRVLLIGCGAVGGHLAFEVSRAGIEHLHLVDPDTLRPENTYRHVLGKDCWGKEKAVMLQYALRSQLPFSKAKAFVTTIEQALADGTINLAAYDLIISAIGNPTSELALNEKVRCGTDGPPIIFTWVDPYGIGGHAVLTGMDGAAGCFECLYTGADDKDALHNRASFAAPNQVFRRSLAGCDTLYTPYGSLDAAQTAQTAARLALDVLIGRVEKNHVRSWKGDPTAFTDQGFILSDRYSLSLDELEQRKTDFAHPSCPVCRALSRGAQS